MSKVNACVTLTMQLHHTAATCSYILQDNPPNSMFRHKRRPPPQVSHFYNNMCSHRNIVTNTLVTTTCNHHHHNHCDDQNHITITAWRSPATPKWMNFQKRFQTILKPPVTLFFKKYCVVLAKRRCLRSPNIREN